MQNFIQYYRKVELFFGNVKFAVVIISVFAVYLGFGTFMESYHGTDYANRLVYKSIPFMGIQFGMFLSILFATLIRLSPVRKNLYGFYVIHAGLIILFIGSWVTYQSGVDGTITLTPNLANRQISINEDELKIQFPTRGKEVTVDLPYVASEKALKMEYEGISLVRFLPFADNVQEWKKASKNDFARSSARYRLFNNNFGEFITLSLHPDSDFNNTLQLGPLNVHYMPDSLVGCFGANTPDGLIVWNGEKQSCISPQASELKKTNIKGKPVVAVNFDGKVLSFVPTLSPLPLDEKLELNESSSYRVFSKKLFEKNPHLFLFGKYVAYFDKNDSLWKSHPLDINGEVALPWMGFKVRLLEYREDAFPTMAPVAVKPVQENGRPIKGELKAVEVRIGDQKFWVKSDGPVAFNKDGERIIFDLGKKSITLPYEIILDQFKMDTDPGTTNPASFESFVTLFKGTEGSTKHHIYMNHPMKHQDFTFYQASYFQTQSGPMGSVLSVNYDPGRFWKYLGSLLLVLGSIWHFAIRSRSLNKPEANNA